MKVLITGSCGLIGSEAAEFYARAGHEVLGVDNNMRERFFGPEGNTSWMRKHLSTRHKNYRHENRDIRNREEMMALFAEWKPEYVLHAASQPSHDWAAREPFLDFEVNALATLNLLESFRKHSSGGVFCFMSTNKVYGDAPNHLPLEELATRYEYSGALRGRGIDEELSIDQNLHSLFGASKLSADVLCQEYGRYFGLNTGIFRGGCLTGSNHSGVPLHGFLSYLMGCALTGQPYKIIGYKGKQVRDQLHARDVVSALECFRKAPRPGEVYNLGGGFKNSASVNEILETLRAKYGLKVSTTYVDEPRRGDHICYYTDMKKFFGHYPSFRLELSLDAIIEEMVSSRRLAKKEAA